MLSHLRKAAAAAVLCTLPFAAPASEWTPPGPITIMIGFAAGGGADTQARLIASAIEENTGWRVLPEQVPGKAGLNLTHELSQAPADGTAIGMVITETLTNNAISSGLTDLLYDQLTPLATTVAFQVGLVAMADGELSSWEKVEEAAAEGQVISIGAASERQADMSYHLSRQTGIDFNIVVLDGGRTVMNKIRGGDLDIGWVAGAQAKAVRQGEMTNIASGIPTPLAETPEAPSIVDLGSKYYLDGHFLFTAPGGLPEEARTALAEAIREAVSDPSTQVHQLIEKNFGGVDVITGDELDQQLMRAAEEASSLIETVSE